MTERRVPEIVSQGNRLRQVFIQGKRPRNRAADRGDFDGMGQPRPQMIAGAVQENLGLIFQSSERARMDDAGTITLKFRPVGVARLGVRPPARLSGFLSERREDANFVRLHLFPPLPALLPTRAGWQIVRHGKEYSWAAAVCEPELAVFV